MDITIEDILDFAINNSIHINKAWRIISMKTKKDTPLIRVLSDDKTTIDYLLTNGATMFGKRHPVETSNPPSPTPLQCAKCFTLGHSMQDCNNKQKCPTCINNNHPIGKCPAVATPNCPNGDGNHPAWSRACHLFKTPITPETPIQPVIVTNPKSDFAEHDPETSDPEPETSPTIAKPIIALITNVIFDLFPLRRAEAQKIIERTSYKLFNIRTKISHSGNGIHFTFPMPN